VRAPNRKRLGLLAAPAVAVALLVLPGCDLQENADLDNGRQLFVEQCGTCHAMTEAGTVADIGPDLDAAFKAARETGMDQDTIEGVVSGQISNPRFTEPDSPAYMPADLVTGDDADDVEPPIPADAPPGAQVFLSQGCGSCHTLAALGDVAMGTVGPNLDDVIPGQTPEQVEQSIVDPEADITAGFPAGVMPDTYGDLPQRELRDLVEYLIEAAGGEQQ
jgi:mono/diheme cytochrome c family protein